MQQMTMDMGLSLRGGPKAKNDQGKPKPKRAGGRRGRVLDSPQPKAICPHTEGDVFVLDADGDHLCYVPVRIRRSSTICYADKKEFLKAVQQAQEDRRRRDQESEIRQGKVDDLVAVDLMIQETGLSVEESEAFSEYLLAHPDATWESCEASQSRLDTRFHFVRFSSWKVAERVLKKQPGISVAGLALHAPDKMAAWLAQGLAKARKAYPTIAMALAIDAGKRLSGEQCRDLDIELPVDWTGKVWVDAVKTAGGGTLFEVNVARKRSTMAEWLCDFPSVESAIDMAALLEVSAPDIIAEMGDNN